jgi:hypothetical protein
MKKLLKKIDRHAQKHRELLSEGWRQTELKEGHAREILARIDGIREQLPAAIKQAHERIIGGRLVANADKILSLYEPDAHVIVRGKADAEIEFGNTLLLGEQKDGVIVDWELIKDPGGRIKGVRSTFKEEPFKQGNFSAENEEFAGRGLYAEWEFVYTPKKTKPAAVKPPAEGSTQSPEGTSPAENNK